MFAHVDMNSYFASVEQQANPHWRGRPLGVCAYLHKHGCVIAASIEAKKLGAKVGMSVDECRQVCPDMVFVQNDPPKYRAVTSRVFSLLHQISDKVEHYSIDEAFLDLKGWYRDEAEAAWSLARMRIRIQNEIGDWLKCSIGIAPSKFLAKLASDLKKPNGLVIITSDNLDETLSTLEIEDACGIGPRIRRRLNKLGIFSLLELKNYPVGNLMRVLGKAGWMWHERLHGRDVDRLEVAGERPPKSVGHSFCVPRRANEQGLIFPIMLRLAERAGRRLRSFGLLAKSMSVQVGFRGQTQNPSFFHPFENGSACSMAFGEPANDVFSLAHGTTELLRTVWDGKRAVSFLAVTFHDLVPPSGQIPLFVPSANIIAGTPFPHYAWERGTKASLAVDNIRDRYGEEAIIFASMLGLENDYAPDRIGFRKTEGVKVN
ncbi:MAG: DNA polymerase IV [Patescibacteria group bacterium]|nr:DNA polymerase IV [Patescibacteria group bacterium]